MSGKTAGKDSVIEDISDADLGVASSDVAADSPVDPPADEPESAVPVGTGLIRTAEEDASGRRPIMSQSPTGIGKARITVADFQVGGKHPTKELPTEKIVGVPGPTFAIREYCVKHGMSPDGGQYTAFEIPGTRRDAGEQGYASTSRQSPPTAPLKDKPPKKTKPSE